MYGANITIDLTAKGEKLYTFPPCNRLWFPKTFCMANGVQSNPTDAVIGVRVGSRNSSMVAVAIQDGYVTSLSGAMDSIWVTILTRGEASSAVLCSGTNVGIGYGSSDGLSPQVFSGSDMGDSLASGGRGRAE